MYLNLLGYIDPTDHLGGFGQGVGLPIGRFRTDVETELEPANILAQIIFTV